MLTVKNSILHSLKFTVGSFLFFGIAWMAFNQGDGDKFLTWICLALFFATFINGVYHLFDRRAKILIDSNGIYFPGQQRGIIDWLEIKEFEIKRDQHQDTFLLELKQGEPLFLKMFFLDIRPEVLHESVESQMKRAAGLPDREELRKNATNSLNSPSTVANLREKDAEDIEIEQNPLPNAIVRKVAAKVDLPADKSLHPEDEEDEEDEDVENATTPSEDSILTRKLQIPQWFSDAPVTNEIIWTGVLSGLLCAILFGFAYLTGDPPKISVAEQILAIIAFAILGPPFLFFISFCKGTGIYRKWAGLSSKKGVSYSVKAKKIAAANKMQDPGKSPRKMRSKKKRR